MPDIDDNRKQPTQELVRGSATRKQRLETADIGVWLIGTNGWPRWNVSALMVSAPARAAEMDMKAVRKAIQEAGLIPALKSITALLTGDKRWLNTRPPLANANAEIGEQLCARFPALLPGAATSDLV